MTEVVKSQSAVIAIYFEVDWLKRSESTPSLMQFDKCCCEVSFRSVFDFSHRQLEAELLRNNGTVISQFRFVVARYRRHTFSFEIQLHLHSIPPPYLQLPSPTTFQAHSTICNQSNDKNEDYLHCVHSDFIDDAHC